jgi:hypothetical protein
MRSTRIVRGIGTLTAIGVTGVLSAALGASANAGGSSGYDRTADIVALQGTQACYGRAQDVVYRNFAKENKALTEGLAAFSKCFVKNANIHIGLDGQSDFESAPDLSSWVRFVRQFGLDHHYLSARHLISNVQVTFTGRDTANVYSAGITPHFVGKGNGADTPGVDWIIGDYESTERRIDGKWMITNLKINASEYANSTATYPLGESAGDGNIGFDDPSAD